jgi:DNA-binding GntR family transcriptional regulator
MDFGHTALSGQSCMQSSNLSAISVGSALKERHSVADRITNSLRDAIRSGALSDGTELNQVALSEHFGVSRVPVREALRALEAEGWITAPTHYRAFVQGLSEHQIEQIFEARSALELHLIEKAVPNFDATRLADLQKRCTAMGRIRDHDQWLAANRAFHRALLAPAGSPMIIDMIEQLASQPERYLRSRLAGRDRQEAAGAEHKAIVAAVASRDVARARKLLSSHIAHTRTAILSAIEDLRSTGQKNPAS